ncbi:hypothetical protein ACIBQ1_08600 [Nonomuraea sp. NPDC050153]
MIEHPPGQAYGIRGGRRSGSFGHVEEAETVQSLLRDFWRQA